MIVIQFLVYSPRDDIVQQWSPLQAVPRYPKKSRTPQARNNPDVHGRNRARGSTELTRLDSTPERQKEARPQRGPGSATTAQKWLRSPVPIENGRRTEGGRESKRERGEGMGLEMEIGNDKYGAKIVLLSCCS